MDASSGLSIIRIQQIPFLSHPTTLQMTGTPAWFVSKHSQRPPGTQQSYFGLIAIRPNN
jgi:hypothetical protein